MTGLDLEQAKTLASLFAEKVPLITIGVLRKYDKWYEIPITDRMTNKEYVIDSDSEMLQVAEKIEISRERVVVAAKEGMYQPRKGCCFSCCKQRTSACPWYLSASNAGCWSCEQWQYGNTDCSRQEQSGCDLNFSECCWENNAAEPQGGDDDILRSDSAMPHRHGGILSLPR